MSDCEFQSSNIKSENKNTSCFMREAPTDWNQLRLGKVNDLYIYAAKFHLKKLFSMYKVSQKI